MIPRRLIPAAALAGALVWSSAPAPAQERKPTENKGVSQQVLATIDLGPEIEGMAGRQLRLRLVTIAPGGQFAYHNHKDRPAVAYVLEGVSTEQVDGAGQKTFKPGDAYAEGKDSAHWGENRGNAPLKLIVVDIVKPR